MNSTNAVTTIRTLPYPHKVKQVRVFTENDPPEGTSGVCVVVKMVMLSFKSYLITSSVNKHLVCLGPIK